MIRALFFALLLAMVGLLSPAQAGWQAGATRQKITPERFLWMAGYGSRNHPATGLLNDLYAKALVIDDGQGTRVAIVTLDLVGISPDLVAPITQEIEARYKLPRANVALCCSHTHSGPVVGHNLRTLHYDQLDAAQQQEIDRYAGELKQAIVGLVGRAIDGLAPCEVSFAHGSVGFAANRRNNKEPEVPKLRAAGQLVGPFDHDVPVLKVVGADGKLKAVLFGYACHATVLDGYDWSSDYPGFAQSELESRHPDCVALFCAGCGADQNPLPRRKVELARQYGQQLAAAVDETLGAPQTELSGKISTALDILPLELAHVPTADELAQDVKSSDRYVAARARHYQQLASAGQKLESTYPYPVQLWKFGPKLTFVTLGGEVVVDYVLRLKHELGAQSTWVAGYTNDVMAYIPSRRVLSEGGYEGAGAMVYYSQPSPWAPTVEEAIISAVRQLAAKHP